MIGRLISDAIPKNLICWSSSDLLEENNLCSLAEILYGLALIIEYDRRKTGFGNPHLLPACVLANRINSGRPTIPWHVVPCPGKSMNSYGINTLDEASVIHDL